MPEVNEATEREQYAALIVDAFYRGSPADVTQVCEWYIHTHNLTPDEEDAACQQFDLCAVSGYNGGSDEWSMAVQAFATHEAKREDIYLIQAAISRNRY